MQTSSAQRRSSKVVTYLRLPVLLATAMMTMGSGMGAGGCGSSGPSKPDCTSGCEISGTYTLTFEDTSELPEGCRRLEATLPTEPMVIRHQYDSSNDWFNIDIGQRWLTGFFKGNGGRKVEASGNHHTNTFGVIHEFELEGTLDAVPETTTMPLTLTGTYRVKDSGNSFSEYEDYDCDVRRAFTAVRVVKE
ncbi:hypothetical protein [Corallococcus exiguus]|uniref:Lipoprotein n=1 Tax=Corallococcus exiguus TaxID=83462 RepID=A0A7X5BRM2_9BACT|nr:hypothetical protein [Corallococcus exiguus]NBC41205.1 hypothetical protein [Corallococcus exiguus]TNV48810.1 hypothetical protein FH620_40905 [Corallococcus exiguus]